MINFLINYFLKLIVNKIKVKRERDMGVSTFENHLYYEVEVFLTSLFITSLNLSSENILWEKYVMENILLCNTIHLKTPF